MPIFFSNVHKTHIINVVSEILLQVGNRTGEVGVGSETPKRAGARLKASRRNAMLVTCEQELVFTTLKCEKKKRIYNFR